MWVYDEDMGLNCRDVTFVPGLYKIFDEILGEYIPSIILDDAKNNYLSTHNGILHY